MRLGLTFVLLPTLVTLEVARAEEPFRIGGVVALTGAAQAWGKAASEGWRLAVDKTNSEGGIRGRPVRLIIEDSRTTGVGAASAFHKLTNVDSADAVVGDVWDFLTMPLIPLAEKKRIVLVSTIVDKSAIRSSPYFFTLGQKIELVAEAVDLFFGLHPDVRRIAVLCWDNDWGYAYNAVWESAAKKHGARIVAQVCTNDLSSDWRAEVLRIAPQKPDAVFFGYQAERILQRLHELNLAPKLLTTSNVVEVLADGTLSPELAEGVYFTDWRPNDDYVRAYRARYGKEPILESHNAYEAIRSIIRAAERNSVQLADGMKTVRFEGVGGLVDFTSSNAGNFARARLFVVQAGKQILVTGIGSTPQ